MATHSSFLAWRIPMDRSLVGYSPWGRKESDTTEQLGAAQRRVDSRAGVLPPVGSGTWRLVAMVAMGLGQLQRFLSCDLGTGVVKEDRLIFPHPS